MKSSIRFIRWPLAILLACAALGLATSAADNAAPAPGASSPASSAPSSTFHSSSPSQPFIPWNQPVINSSPWDHPDLDLGDRGDRQRWVKRLEENPATNPFIPPHPPALAEPLPATPSPLFTPLPSGLLDFASETFYMSYGALLKARQISEQRAERIARYRAARDQLVAELRTLLDQTKNLPAPRRTEALREFSSAQTHRATALENEAESIRLDLTTPGLFRFGSTAYDLARDADWSRDVAYVESFAYILPLVGAQYYSGFSPDQRLLLHEMTMEQRARDRPSSPASKPTSPDYLFFLPSTSRIKLPADLPPDLAEKTRRFRTQKDTLKSELQSALDRHQFRLVNSRTERFAQLAREQAPAFAELHALAEEIRRGLVSIQYPDAPSGASLPRDLTERVGHATTRKAALQRELLARFKALQSELPGERIEILRRGQGLALLIAGPPSRSLSRDQRERLLAETESFNASIGSRYTDLAAEMDRLRNDLRAVAPAAGRSSPKDIDRLAAEFDRSYKKQEAWNRYRDYHAAVLVPGLSPELRRLLYRAAWSDLFKQQVLSTP